ncbi:maleylpyruvate isomerase N-terminal domain-containing protein [Nocardia sp. NPDC057030]|uniref:maleylpyruvate isomerase N-terminal domain-containing protein n=1 Tax=unclassified Nocardia TaxID=2637762 RepID=UPI003629BF5D
MHPTPDTPQLHDSVLDLAGAALRRTQQIIDALSAADDKLLDAPSDLPDWSRLNIICHLRYGAVALARLTSAALAGVETAYYPGRRDRQREATLRLEPGEDAMQAVLSLAHESARLHELWSTVPNAAWQLGLPEPADNQHFGTLRLGHLPILRLTEIEVHSVDLGLGLDDWGELFVRAALPFRLQWINTRRSNHKQFDDRVTGSWLLRATDGPAYLVTANGSEAHAFPSERSVPATATIEASSRDLLAFLIGRPCHHGPLFSGDVAFAKAFTRAFPVP